MIDKTFQILVLEDNDGDVYLLKKALTNAGVRFQMTVIEDGASGLAFARRRGEHAAFIPDLAVLDLNLPKGGGLAVLEAIRMSKDLEHLPVVIATSSATSRERVAAENFKVAQFITKPSALEECLKVGAMLKALLMKP